MTEIGLQNQWNCVNTFWIIICNDSSFLHHDVDLLIKAIHFWLNYLISPYIRIRLTLDKFFVDIDDVFAVVILGKLLIWSILDPNMASLLHITDFFQVYVDLAFKIWAMELVNRACQHLNDGVEDCLATRTEFVFGLRYTHWISAR